MPLHEAVAYLGLGSNLGDKKANLDGAIQRLEAIPTITVKAISTYRTTSPVGYVEQPDFLNAVVRIGTTESPLALLSHCNAIEQQLKRKRIIHWGPRTIDVDILLYDDLVTDDPKLTIPHPRMTERLFVMEPLAELAPDLVHPITGKTMKAIKETLETAT